MAYDVAGARGTQAAGGLRTLVASGRAAGGGWCMIASPLATEIVSASGCEWLCLDLQHGQIGEAEMRAMLMAAAIRRTPAFVRVPWNEPAAIMRALDAGADGIIVPMVNTPQEAERAVAAVRYPPAGYRSWGPLRSLMSTPGFDPAMGNREIVLLVMIETVEAVEQLDAILAVPGLDGVFVGPHDLAISHAGTNAQAGVSPRDVEMITAIAAACRARNLAAGIACANGADARRYAELGYTLLALASDAALLGEGLAGILADAGGRAP